MCSAIDWCSECSHLSLLQFQAYVKDTEKHSVKEKQQPSHLVVSVRSVLTGRIRLLRPLGPAGFADGRASVRPSPRFVPGVRGPQSSPGSGPSVVAAGSRGTSLSVSPLPGLAPGVSGGQAPSVPSPALELAVGRVSLHVALPSALPLVASGMPSHTVPGPSTHLLGFDGVSLCTAPLPSLALGVSGVQSADFSGFGVVSLSAAPLPSVAPAVSVVQTPTVSGASREFAGLGGMSLGAASLCSVALGLSGLQAPADPVSSVACPEVPPQPVDAGMDPIGTEVSQAAATGWP
ncbi:hypothetical protein E2C01_048252 [Portunus trituberculatus]|uniref:Uncharacterized protein n=1 Tax=Portunus trituberculatus TaxID=210409 RepID=A0A5B7G5X4_PORTR|nr:hypothetical protein [Portunus trituberculatus]